MSEKKIGERIRLVRKNTGCNQKEFGSLLNIPQSTLSAYETNRMQPTVASRSIGFAVLNAAMEKKQNRRSTIQAVSCPMILKKLWTMQQNFFKN